jgi:hypothetical protein
VSANTIVGPTARATNLMSASLASELSDTSQFLSARFNAAETESCYGRSRQRSDAFIARFSRIFRKTVCWHSLMRTILPVLVHHLPGGRRESERYFL